MGLGGVHWGHHPVSAEECRPDYRLCHQVAHPGRNLWKCSFTVATCKRHQQKGECLVPRGRTPQQKNPGPPGWGLNIRPIPSSHKNYAIMETSNESHGHSDECVRNVSTGLSSAACCVPGDIYMASEYSGIHDRCR